MGRREEKVIEVARGERKTKWLGGRWGNDPLR